MTPLHTPVAHHTLDKIKLVNQMMTVQFGHDFPYDLHDYNTNEPQIEAENIIVTFISRLIFILGILLLIFIHTWELYCYLLSLYYRIINKFKANNQVSEATTTNQPSTQQLK